MSKRLTIGLGSPAEVLDAVPLALRTAVIVRTSHDLIGDWSSCRRSSCSQCAASKKDSSLASWPGGGWCPRVGGWVVGSPAMQLATLCLAIRTHSQTFCPANRRILDILRIPLDAHVSEAEYPYGILMCVCVCERPLDSLPKEMHCRAADCPSVCPRCSHSAGLRRRCALRLVGQTFVGCSGKSARLSGPPPQLANKVSFRMSASAMVVKERTHISFGCQNKIFNRFCCKRAFI